MDTVSQPPQTISKTSPRDFFLHLLSAILLYVSAASFVAAVFSYIDLTIRDPLEAGNYQIISAKTGLRTALSGLVVFFPVYLLVMYYLQKIYARDAGKRNLRIRRWLIYFTLFAAALIILGGLVSLVNYFLSGELTLRFGLKLMTLLVVTGAIFGYYLWDARRHSTE